MFPRPSSLSFLLLTALSLTTAFPLSQDDQPPSNSTATSSNTTSASPNSTPVPYNNWPPLPINTRILQQPAAQITWNTFSNPPLSTTRIMSEGFTFFLNAVAAQLRISSDNIPDNNITTSIGLLLPFNETEKYTSTSGSTNLGVQEGGVKYIRLFCPDGGFWPSKQFRLDALGEIMDKISRWGFVGVEFGVLGNRYETVVSGCSLGPAPAGEIPRGMAV